MSRFLDNELFVLFFIIAVFLCIMGIAILLDKRRRKVLVALAGRYGLSHEDSDPTLLDQGFASFPLFDQGYSRDYTNIMKGNIDGLPVILFDYSYTVSGGKHSSTYRQSVACYRLEGGNLSPPTGTLSCPESHPGWSVEGGGEWVAVFKPNRRITKENFRSFLDDTRGIAGRFKTGST